jgi:type 1 glutamine amidotransferase
VLPGLDQATFLKWIESGKGFVGIHAATDTFHSRGDGVDPYIKMIGGEFKTHGAQVEVDVINQDPKFPACTMWGDNFKIFDEIYQFKNFERPKIHGLLTMDKHPNDKTPGDYPVSWCKKYGQGRVVYTSLGHREDVWDPNWKERNGSRKDAPELAEKYQQHLLGGILWALGLEEGDATPQVKEAIRP